jgi:hypothetical protein
MAFVNLSLLIGGLFTVIPIVLHLVMRQKAKQLVFPALQFLKQRRETNRRTLQLRHWLLMALRCLAVAVIVLALARPSVDSTAIAGWLMSASLLVMLLVVAGCLIISLVQGKGRLLIGLLSAATALLLIVLAISAIGNLRDSPGVLLGDQQAPVAAALVIDSSPAMMYRFENQTRLEVARETAAWLIGQFPSDSDVAIVEARPEPALFSVDLSAARKAVSRLQADGNRQPLPRAILGALRLLANSDKTRKEIYVFTDLTLSSWKDEQSSTLRDALDDARDVTVYVIDVGVDAPRNVALGALKLSAETLAGDNDLVVETEVTALGIGGRCVVELFVEELDSDRPMIVDGQTLLPKAVRRDHQEYELDRDGSKKIRFHVRGLPVGLHHGSIRLTQDDNLAVDNVRYFTVNVVEAWPVLVVAPKGVDATSLTEAIAPFEYRETNRARFHCTVIGQGDLENHSLQNYAVVSLVDPGPVTPSQWQRLARYVERGGGLAVFLGHNAALKMATSSFNIAEAKQLLGAKLARVWRSPDRDLFLSPVRYDHAVLAAFRQQATSVPWDAAPIFLHWVLNDLGPDTTVVALLSNGKPAIVETVLGKGRVLTWATPVSDPLRPAGRACWNELPTSEVNWPYFVLINESIRYLAGTHDQRFNYVVGETARIQNNADEYPIRYDLFPPRDELMDVKAHQGVLTVRVTDQPGAYRLKGFRGGPVTRGFAVNLTPRESDLRRLSQDQLESMLGKDRYQLARDRDEIVLEVGHARVGREFYPYLMVLLVIVVGLEHLFSNRFYRKPT